MDGIFFLLPWNINEHEHELLVHQTQGIQVNIVNVTLWNLDSILLISYLLVSPG